MKKQGITIGISGMVLFLLATLPGFGQQGYRISGKSLVELRQEAGAFSFPESFNPPNSRWVFRNNFLLTRPNRPSPALLHPGAQPLIYSYHDLALFCKLEVKLERAVRLPVKIRLGDVQYVDWLEGKKEVLSY